MRQSPCPQFVTIFSLSASLAVTAFAKAQVMFQGLGHFESGVFTRADGVNWNGTLVSGIGTTSDTSIRAFTWTLTNGFRFASPSNAAPQINSAAVVRTGLVMFGTVTIGESAHACLVENMRDVVLIDPPNTDISYAWAASNDGRVVAGWTWGQDGHFPYRWTPEGGTVSLGSLGGDNGWAYGMNADGTVIVGGALESNPYNTMAFRWTPGGGMLALGRLGGTTSRATATNARGDIVVGSTSVSSSSGAAFIWTADLGLRQLGTSRRGTGIAPTGVSGDGKYAVGTSESNSAVIWVDGAGPFDLNVYLPTLGVDLSGWHLGYARAISEDGSTIIGTGTYLGRTEAWMFRFRCATDVTADGVVDWSDLQEFSEVWQRGDESADFTADGFLDFFDYDAFVEAYENGC